MKAKFNRQVCRKCWEQYLRQDLYKPDERQWYHLSLNSKHQDEPCIVAVDTGEIPSFCPYKLEQIVMCKRKK